MSYIILAAFLLCLVAMTYAYVNRNPRLEAIVGDDRTPVRVAPASTGGNALTEWDEVLLRALDHIYSGVPASTERQMMHLFDEPPALTRTAMTSLVKSFERVGTLHSSLASLESSGTSMRELADLITRDPLLSARVLKTVNSPFFSTATNVKSIHTALNILGLANLKNLIAFGVMPYALFTRPEHRRMFMDVWQHMNATAITASAMARAAGEMDSGTLYTAGLMHDIGKLILILLIQDPTEDERYPQTLDRETERLAVTHLQAAQFLAGTGGIPAELHSLVLDHHLPALLPVSQLHCDSRHARHLTVLFLADQVAKLISPQGTLLDDVRHLDRLEPSFREIVSKEEARRILMNRGLIDDIVASVRITQAMLN